MPRLEVKARVGADVTPLERAFAKAKTSGDGLGKSLKRSLAGAFSGAALAGIGRHMKGVADNIRDMAKQMQVTTDEAQRIAFEAEQTGNKFTDIRMNLNRLGQARERAIRGDEKQLELFTELGVSMKDLEDRSRTDLDLLKQIGAALKTATPGEIFSFKGLFGVEAFKTLEAVKGLSEERDIPLISEQELQRMELVNQQLDLMAMQVDQLLSKPYSQMGTSFAEGVALFGGAFKGMYRFATEGPSGAADEKRKYQEALRLRQEARLRVQMGLSGGLIPANAGTDPEAIRANEELEKAMAEANKAAANYEYQKLDAAGRRLTIEKEIAKLEMERDKATDEAERARISAAIWTNKTALLAFREKESADRTLAAISHTPGSDSLGRIGGAAGATARTSERHLSDIRRELQALNRRVDRGIRLEDAL